MKKMRLSAALLCLAVLLQLFSCPVTASETTTSPTQETTAPQETMPQAPAGNTFTGADVSLTNGCRTPDARVAIQGSEKLLDTAQAAILYEMSTGTMLYSYNPDIPMPPSSFVKIMTAMLAVENGDPSEIVTVTQSALDNVPKGSQVVGLQSGEQLTLLDLLYCMMVGSGNDAAVIIADHIAGSQEAFVAMMNSRAKELGCSGTVYTNCHGIHDEAQVTTARDTVKILLEALKDPTFRKVFGTGYYSVPATGKSEARDLFTTNYFISDMLNSSFYDTRVTGGRTGVNDDNTRSIVVTAEDQELQIMTVVMGAEQKIDPATQATIRHGSLKETETLIDLGFDKHKVCQLFFEDQITGQYTVQGGANSVAVGPSSIVRVTLPKNADMKDLTWRTQELTAPLTAPVESGQKITALQVWYGNICVARTDLLAKNSAAVKILGDQNEPNSDGFDAGALSTALMVLGAIFIIVLVLGGGLFIIRSVRGRMKRSKKRKRRQNRRRSR